MRRVVSILPLLFLAVLAGVMIGSQPAVGTSMTVTVNEGTCVQIGTVPSGSGSWSMDASRPFEGVVTSSTGYSYGPSIASIHQGPATNANYFLSGCNVCPGGPLQVTFQFPGSPDSNSPRSFAAQGYPADCGGVGLGGIDEIPLALLPIVGPLALLAALVAVVVGATLPVPRDPGSAQIAPPQLPLPQPQAPPVQVGQLVPAPPIYPLQPPQQPPLPMIGPGPRLQPTPWIYPVGQGTYHDVPADAPRIDPAPPGYPANYPFPRGTYSRMPCPFCGFPTLCPFTDGWFCTNLQCRGRTSNATQFVQKQWYQPTG